MTTRRPILLLLGMTTALALTGCQANRELLEGLVELKNDSSLQLMLLDRHNQFLISKVEKVTRNLEALEAINARLSREFAVYTSRPDAIKRDILGDVSFRASEAAEKQRLFTEEFSDRLNKKETALNQILTQNIQSIQKTLDYEDEFFRFVFTMQDSINREFATRFDSRPWYQSLLGKWEGDRDMNQSN